MWNFLLIKHHFVKWSHSTYFLANFPLSPFSGSRARIHGRRCPGCRINQSQIKIHRSILNIVQTNNDWWMGPTGPHSQSSYIGWAGRPLVDPLDLHTQSNIFPQQKSLDILLVISRYHLQSWFWMLNYKNKHTSLTKYTNNIISIFVFDLFLGLYLLNSFQIYDRMMTMAGSFCSRFLIRPVRLKGLMRVARTISRCVQKPVHVKYYSAIPLRSPK